MTKANQGFLFELFRSGDKAIHGETKESRSVPPKIAFIDRDLIRPNPAEPRKTSNEAGLRELADSIQKHGLLNPILVRQSKTGRSLPWQARGGSRPAESLAYVRDQLGHLSIQITVDTYGHLVPGGNRRAVNRLDDGNKVETFEGILAHAGQRREV